MSFLNKKRVLEEERELGNEMALDWSLRRENEVEKVNLKELGDIYRGKGIKCFGWENW